MMVPAKSVLVPSVAELPTCQNTLHACAPLMSVTELSVAVVRVVPIWKIHTASGSFWPSRVSSPVSPAEVSAVYTPGTSVCPPRSAVISKSLGCPAATLYAVVRSAFACWATASFAWIVPPTTVPGGNPVIAVPGATPRSPLRMLGPVFVTVEPARTTNESAVPRLIAVAA